MATDIIIMADDTVKFEPTFGVASLSGTLQGTMPASGKTTLNGTKVCVEGDEKNLVVSGCMYKAPPFAHVPGIGVLKIKKLAPDQLTQKTKSGGKPLILQGAKFDAVFEVTTPAQLLAPPAPPQPDAAPSYAGKGEFIPNNSKIKAT